MGRTNEWDGGGGFVPANRMATTQRRRQFLVAPPDKRVAAIVGFAGVGVDWRWFHHPKWSSGVWFGGGCISWWDRLNFVEKGVGLNAFSGMAQIVMRGIVHLKFSGDKDIFDGFPTSFSPKNSETTNFPSIPFNPQFSYLSLSSLIFFYYFYSIYSCLCVYLLLGMRPVVYSMKCICCAEWIWVCEFLCTFPVLFAYISVLLNPFSLIQYNK